MPITMTPGDMKYRDENGVYHDLNYIKGDVIDDTAGVGDTDVTFSADKITAELNALNKTWKMLYSGTATVQDWGDTVNYVQFQNFFETDDHIFQGDVWRITWNATRYVCTATEQLSDLQQYGTGYVLGNATLSGGTSGNDEPFCAYEYSNGTLMFDTHASTGSISIVIERQVEAERVEDVQLNGASIVQNGVANVPICSNNAFGVVKVDSNSFGIKVNVEGKLYTDTPSLVEIKAGSQAYKPITPVNEHTSAFYGLAKAAGNTDQSSSSNSVGTYTDDAKLKIQQMLGLWAPKFHVTWALENDAANMNSVTPTNIGDIELNIWEELLILIYQDGTTEGGKIADNNFSYFSIRDTVNNTYFPLSSLYAKGDKPNVLSIKRFPNTLFCEMVGGSTYPTTAAVPRTSDYVDKIRAIYFSGNNATLKAGTTLEVVIHRFI